MRRSLVRCSKPAWRFLEQPLEGECRVLFAGPHFHAGLPLTKQVLEERIIAGASPHLLERVTLIHAPTPTDLFDHAPNAHVAIPFMEHFQADFFDPKTTPNLRLAIQFGVGLERVDVDAATKAGIAISNIPADGTGNAEATSEHAIFLTMSLLRYASIELPHRFQNQVLGGLPAPRTLFRKRVTVVGFGSVGKVLTRYLIHMGAHVTVVRNSSWGSEEEECPDTRLLTEKGTKALLLNEALPTTDVLILAVTMTPETLHLMNHDTTSMLPRGALIVNVGRGPLVEYAAILAALKSGAVGGFASDVGVGGHPTAPSEPWDPNDELSQLENTLFTPHVGGYTDYSYDKMANKIVDAIKCVMRGKPPLVWVNAPSNGSDQTY